MVPQAFPCTRLQSRIRSMELCIPQLLVHNYNTIISASILCMQMEGKTVSQHSSKPDSILVGRKWKASLTPWSKNIAQRNPRDQQRTLHQLPPAVAAKQGAARKDVVAREESNIYIVHITFTYMYIRTYISHNYYVCHCVFVELLY